MAKKYFYNRVYNTKRTVIRFIIIGICIVGVIVCFVAVSKFQGENKNTPEKKLNIKNEVTIEVNEKYSDDIFFSKIENVNLDDIKITYDNNFDISTPGRYKVTININNKDYTSTLIIVDTTKPNLLVKELTIKEGESYQASDFVASCTDNSTRECIIEFYTDGVDQEGNKVDYSSYTEAGTYSVKISAKDASNNQIVEETKLIINNKDGSAPKPVQTPDDNSSTDPSLCKYGNDTYDTEQYLIAVMVATDHCAVSLDLYKNTTITAEINALMLSETTRIQKEIGNLNLEGTLSLNRGVIAVVNKTGDGIVGYELRMTVSITNNNKTEVIEDYKVDTKGKRVYIINEKNLPE